MLTVLTWLWSQRGGRTRFRAGHVNVWAGMVRRHLRMPHRIACVTDDPLGLDQSIEIIPPPGDFENITIPSWGGGKPNCLRRIAMFRPDAAAIFGERFVCMDIDCVISGPLDPLFSRRADIVLYRGTNGSRPYNGSMLMMTAGSRPHVYERFTPEKAAEAGRRFIGSDQAWMSYQLGWGEETWGHEHGVQWWASRHNRDDTPTVMFFPGYPKPWDLFGGSGFVTEHYRGDGRGRCIVLSVGPTVWQDAARAVLTPYDAVVALPETAAHWPGPIREIAEDEGAAIAAARVHGCDDVVICGAVEQSQEAAA